MSASTARVSSNPARDSIAVLEAPRQYQLQLQHPPQSTHSTVVVRLEGCGVCASSLPVWEGRPWFDYPMAAGAPGHEGWGYVVETGKTVSHVKPGQRVACLGDRAFAQYVNVAADQVVPIPDELNDMPFPGEAIGCAMNIFRRADVHPGQSLTIIGAGFLGLLLVQLAVDAGARVFVLSRRAFARDLAKEYGAEAAFDTEDWWGNAHKIVNMTDNRGCDRVIEVTGMQFALNAATEIIAEYGKLIVAGFHQDGPREINMQIWNWRGIDVINAHERDPSRYIQGIQQAITATLAGRIRPQNLLTHRFTLEQLDEAFQLMIDRPNGFVKGWVQL